MEAEAKAAVASIRTRVGQIRKALERKDLWAIDHAIAQLSMTADDLERSIQRPSHETDWDHRGVSTPLDFFKPIR